RPLEPAQRPTKRGVAMVSETALKRALRRLAEALRHYATTQKWGPDDYQVFVHYTPDWGQLYFILVGRAFAVKDGENPWFSVRHFLEHELKDVPDLWEALHWTVQTFDQVKARG